MGVRRATNPALTEIVSQNDAKAKEPDKLLTTFVSEDSNMEL